LVALVGGPCFAAGRQTAVVRPPVVPPLAAAVVPPTLSIASAAGAYAPNALRRMASAAATFAMVAVVAVCRRRSMAPHRCRRHPGARRVVVAAAAAQEAVEGAMSEPGEEDEAYSAEEPKAKGEESAAEENGDEGGGPEVEASAEAAEETKRVKEEKWACVECGAMNFPTVSECHKCGAGKPSQAELALLEEKTSCKKKVNDVMDKLIRLQADLQNYRRQHGESMSKSNDLGKRDALRRLVPISEEIEKALVAPADVTEREKSLFESYSLLFKKVHDVWSKFGVENQVVEVGAKFDPAIHRKAEERVAQGEQTPGTILEVVTVGWTCEGKVLIPSEVAIVAFPKSEEKPADEQAAEHTPVENETREEPDAVADGKA